MSFGQDFLKGFFGADALKDYAHASKTFRTNGYEFAPRNKFLFHVFFTINTQQIPALRNSLFAGNNDQSTIGLMVKSAQLPTYTMSVDTLNQYNRKRLAQTKIDYNPVTIEFHDDGGDLIRNMWYNYYSYYYKDPSQAYDSPNNQNGQIAQIQSPAGFSYNSRDIYNNSRTVNDWGYIGEGYEDGLTGFGFPSGKPPFFRDIRIYGLYQKKWAEYIMINPMITEWSHDTYDYSQGGGTMTNRMTIRYETVKYYSGAVGGVRPDTNVVGFADPSYYDTVPSALNRPGATQTVLGQGGLLDAGIGIIEDLQAGGVAGLVGAVQKAGTAYYTFKDKNIRSVVNEDLNQSARSVLRQGLPGATRAVLGTTPSASNRGALEGIFFPTPPNSGRTPPFNPRS